MRLPAETFENSFLGSRIRSLSGSGAAEPVDLVISYDVVAWSKACESFYRTKLKTADASLIRTLERFRAKPQQKQIYLRTFTNLVRRESVN